MSDVAPLEIRELRAVMELKGLSLQTVSDRAKVNYSICSRILRGRLHQPETLARIREVIEDALMPKEIART